MKIIFPAIVALLSIGVSSCLHDTVKPDKPDPDGKVTFRVSIPNPALPKNTRFSNGGGVAELDPNQYRLRVTMQAWQGDTILVQTYSEQVQITASQIAFDATITQGTYNLLFWADFVGVSPDTTFYDTTSLQAVLRKTGAGYANGYQYDAYCGALTGQVITSGYTLPEPTALTRPFGRLELVSPNWQSGSGSAGNLNFGYIAPIPQGYNILKGDVTKDVMTPTISTALIGGATGATQDLVLDYIFAAADGSTTISGIISSTPLSLNVPVMNIPIIRGQRSVVSINMGINSTIGTLNSTSTCALNSMGGYTITIPNNWSSAYTAATTIKALATSNGYCLPVVQTLTSAQISGDTATIVSPLLAPNTSYIIQLLDNNNKLLAVGNVTTAAIPTSNVNVITVGQGEWRPDLSLKITQPGTYYIMPGEYQISAQDLTVNGSLSLIGNDPTQVQIYYAVHPVSVYGTNVNLQFIDMHITTNSANIVELQTAQNYSISNILFQNCVVNLNQYGGTDASMVSAQNTNPAYTSTIGTYTVNNCIIYGQGAQSNANIFQGATGGNATVQINNINVSNSTIVDTGGGFVSVKSASGLDFPYSINFTNITAFNILNWAGAWNPMSLFEMTATGSSTKRLTLNGTVFHLGSLFTTNPSYARWFNFSTATGGYPTITVVGDPVFYGFGNQTINYGAGTPPYGVGNPVYFISTGNFSNYPNPATSLWINPTNNPSTFNFGFLDPTLQAVVQGGIYSIGDPRWN